MDSSILKWVTMHEVEEARDEQNPSLLPLNNLLAKQMWVQSLGWEDPLEKEMATHSSILAWEIPWTEEPGRLQSMGLQKSWTRLND